MEEKIEAFASNPSAASLEKVEGENVILGHKNQKYRICITKQMFNFEL